MIKQSVKNRYVFSQSLRNRIDTALNYLENTDLDVLPDGTYEINGDDVYAMIQSFNVKDPIDAEFETHREYLDIQYVLSGTLEFRVAERGCLATATAYDAENDLVLYERAKESSWLRLYPGEYAVLFPTDAHRMICFPADGEQTNIRKVVIKVSIGGDDI